MPFLAPLIPIMMSIIPEAIGGIGSALGGIGSAIGAGDILGALGGIAGLPGAIGGSLAPGLAGVGGALGIPSAIATPLAGFLSPEIIGGGLGEAFGGTKGLEEGLLAGATMGGGLGSLGDLVGTGLNAAGAPGLADAAIAAGQGGGMADLGLRAATPFLNQAIASQGQPQFQAQQPTRTIAPTPTPSVGSAPAAGPSGLSLAGNTAPQVGPWQQTFWGGGGGGSTGNVPNMGMSAAPATSTGPSATNQQQLTSP